MKSNNRKFYTVWFLLVTCNYVLPNRHTTV